MTTSANVTYYSVRSKLTPQHMEGRYRTIAAQRKELDDLKECAEALYGVVEDMLPQIAKICLQDYGRLNRGLMLADRLLGNHALKPGEKVRCQVKPDGHPLKTP